MKVLLKKSLEEIYFKTIIPSVTYGISVWGNCQPSALNFLNSTHARAACIIKELQSSLADDTSITKSNWLPISYFYKRSVLMLMHKVFYESSSHSICEPFSKRINSRSFRIQNQFNNIIRLRWLKTVSNIKILTGRYNHSLSLDAIIMVSKNCPIIGEHVVIIFVTQ